MAERLRWGGKGKRWSMRLLDDHDLAQATRYALGAAHYHFDGMTYFTNRLKKEATWANGGLTEKGQTYFNKFYHHLRAFFWELVAAFDTLLQEINRRLQLGVDERSVDWDTISRALSERREHRKFLRRLSKGYNSPWFVQVREYRNFAHRGTVLVEAVAVDSEFRPEDGVQFIGMILRPASGGRGTGEPIRLCKRYGKEVAGFIDRTLAELDLITPAEHAEPGGAQDRS